MTDVLGSRARVALKDLTLRPYAGESDLPEFVRMENAESTADRIPERHSLEWFQNAYAHPGDKFDPARDVTVATIDGRIVGYSQREWVDTSDGALREYRLHGVVDVALRRQGIGTVLLLDSERRTRELAGGHDTTRQRVVASFTAEFQVARNALLANNGYQPVRWFFDMVRPSMDDIPQLPLPDGLEVRSVTPDLYRRVWDADMEAFRDHWGGHDASDAAFQRWTNGPLFNPDLWVIAFDGDEPAGGVINSINPEENAELGFARGWLNSVWTRRPWRRRGLAKATIARSLELLRDAGMTSAALGVDADNPSGALGLYEDMGFGVDHRYAAWRKPLDSPAE